jgi:glutaminyl-tRNA synthetase
MYDFAETLIRHGEAYVDSQSAEEMRANRGTLTEPGKPSPFRNRTPDENLDLFRRMKAGEFADGAHVLRAKIDMASGNINLRDPAIYRIRKATHHNTGDAWCIYPMYTYAHPIEDALENITHSICTLEFEDQRPFYDWLLGKLAEHGCVNTPLPQQIEFARLNLTYVVLSKRKLIQLVDEKHVDRLGRPAPADPGRRAPSRLHGRGLPPLRRDDRRHQVRLADRLQRVRGMPARAPQRTAPRRIAVLDPLKLVIDNYPEGRKSCAKAPNHPQKPELGKRPVPFAKELWIEREDFIEAPPKGYFRLFPGNKVRLRYGFVVECTGCDKDAAGNVVAVHCNYFADSKSGTPGSDTYKVKGNIHWVSARHAYAAEVRLYDRLFKVPSPGRRASTSSPTSTPIRWTISRATGSPSLKDAAAEDRFQFERHGYFVADRIDSQPGAPVFNRAVTLKDSWAKAK